jgi:hydrogenase maturation protein HypF
MTWGDVQTLPVLKGSYFIGLKPLIKVIIEEVQTGKSLSEIGGKFHRTLAGMIAEVSQKISALTGLRKVALSGGCFQNRHLLRMTVAELRRQGLEPLLHHHVPTNDGCVSLGQAAIGHFALKGS